jgi:hypothetical protein
MSDLLELTPQSQVLEQSVQDLLADVIKREILTPDQILIATALEVLQAREDYEALQAVAVYN